MQRSILADKNEMGKLYPDTIFSACRRSIKSYPIDMKYFQVHTRCQTRETAMPFRQVLDFVFG